MASACSEDLAAGLNGSCGTGARGNGRALLWTRPRRDHAQGQVLQARRRARLRRKPCGGAGGSVQRPWFLNGSLDMSRLRGGREGAKIGVD